MQNWTRTLVPPSASIRTAIERIDAVGLQIALVVDDATRLLGTVTDGDVRRAILRGVPLDDRVSTIMNVNPTTARVEENRDVLLALMRQRRLHQIPILDESRRVVGLELLDELFTPAVRPNAVVLMAGGLGSRLRPLTDECPKPLLRVGSKPILESIINSFAKHGFRRFYVSVNYKAEMVEAHFGDGSDRDVEISYLREDQPLGTAGALSLLPDRPSEPLFVMNADLLTQLNFAHLLEFHSARAPIATMCVREYHMQVPYGVIDTHGNRVVAIREKPTHRYLINAGVYLLDPRVLDLIPAGQFLDMTDLFRELIRQQLDTAVFPIREYWIDVGRPEDFEAANGEYEDVFAE